MCHENEEWYEFWRGIDPSVQNWHEFDELWHEDSNLEKVLFNGLLLTKVYNICSKENWLLQIIICSKKNTEIVIFDDTDYWCQTWRKTDLCFQKWHEEFGKFSFTDWKIAISS